MAEIRRFSLGMVLLFGSMFTVMLVVTYIDDSIEGYIANILIDVEGNTEHSENQETENKLRECKINNLNSFTINRHFISNCSEYGQLDTQRSLEVFLEIVSPPPEA